MSDTREPYPVELLATEDQRREPFPNSPRSKAIRKIVGMIGEAGFREFLKNRQPGFQDKRGAYLLEHHAEALLERLQKLEPEAFPEGDDA